MKQFGLTETKIFHFHRIFKNEGGELGSSEPPRTPSGCATVYKVVYPAKTEHPSYTTF